MTPFIPPLGYARIVVVASFAELVSTPLEGDRNAICWQRDLPGDFGEVVQHFAAGEGITTLTDAGLQTLPLRAAGRAAVDVLLADRRLLQSIGHSPELDCIHAYVRDRAGPVRTDVHSFHVDGATVATDTYLCCYTGPASEGLRNDEARRHVDIASTRTSLRERFGGNEGPEFEAWLHEHFFDLHYAPLAHARPFSFGIGNLWRLAVQHPGSRVPACIHRAPATMPGQPPRLLLIC